MIWDLKPNKDSQNVFDLMGMVAFLGLVSFIKKELSIKEGLKLLTEQVIHIVSGDKKIIIK